MKMAAGFALLSSLLIGSLQLALVSSSSSSSSGVLLPLSHSLSHTPTAETPHLVKASSARSTARFRHHRGRRRREIPLPLASGSDYTLSLSLGPHKSVTLYMDTGSDLVWFPCHPFECILCEGKPKSTPYNLSSSSAPVPCDSRFCSAAHSSLPSSDLCAIAKCSLDNIETSDCSSSRCPPFYYAYGDGSLVANLHRESLLIPTSKPNSPYIRLRNFTFGCAHTALAEPIGVAGFGRGALSLPAQLSSLSPHLGSRFSYCLIAHSFDSDRLRRPSPLILGRSEAAAVEGEEEFVYTPLLHNPKHPYFYSVGLEAISVGRKRIPAPESMRTVNRRGDGGVAVDSGTTFTMLPPGIHAAVLDAFDEEMGGKYERASEVEASTGLGRCYFHERATAPAPAVVLHFAGNASVALPRRNYFMGLAGPGKRRVGCVMVMSGGDEPDDDAGGGPAAVLGNFQQQGFEVVYDLRRLLVGFARRRCASLWETVSRD